MEAQAALWHQAFLSELAAAKRSFEGLKAELPAGPALPQLVEEDEGMKGMSAELAHIKTAANMQVRLGSRCT